jgi:hypothetical protein
VFAVTVTALAAAPTSATASTPDAAAPDAGAPVACDSAALVAAIASANDTPSADAVTTCRMRRRRRDGRV